MTALGTDAPNVAGLVYIAAFGLDQGESLGGLLAQGPVTPEDMDKLEEFFFSRGAAVNIEMCPMADSSLMELLGKRGELGVVAGRQDHHVQAAPGRHLA